MRKAAGNKRHVLADDDFCFLVIQREDVGCGQNISLLVGLQCAGQRAQVQYFTDAGNIDFAAYQADIQAGADSRDIAGSADDVLAQAAEVGAADDVGTTFVNAGEVLPLDTEFRGHAGAHLDDQCFDEHLGATRIELVDHRAQRIVNMIRRDDHQ